jgi:hypothetical protein
MTPVLLLAGDLAGKGRNMKSYVYFRRHPLGQVVPPSNEDHSPGEVVPYGLFGAGLWTGHPIGFLIASGIVLVGLNAIPAYRWFFGVSVLLGGAMAYLLFREHQRKPVRQGGEQLSLVPVRR